MRWGKHVKAACQCHTLERAQNELFSTLRGWSGDGEHESLCTFLHAVSVPWLSQYKVEAFV